MLTCEECLSLKISNDNDNLRRQRGKESRLVGYTHIYTHTHSVKRTYLNLWPLYPLAHIPWLRVLSCASWGWRGSDRKMHCVTGHGSLNPQPRDWQADQPSHCFHHSVNPPRRQFQYEPRHCQRHCPYSPCHREGCLVISTAPSHI